MLSYGLGDAGTGLAASQLGFYLLPFFTCAAGLPVWIGGLLLMVTKLWDGLNDPLIGWLSDHTQSRWGPRLPWMLGAAVPLGISLAGIWWVPPGGLASKITYYIFMVLLLMTAYTSVNLPYAALSTELTKTTSIRTRLNAARFTGSILASLTGLVVASLLTSNGLSGYISMGRISGAIAALSTLACCWGLAPFAKKAQKPKKQSEPFTKQLSRIIHNNCFLRVLALYLLLWCGLQIMQSVALFYLVQVMRIPPGMSTWILLPFMVSSLIGLQVWSLYSNKHGRIKSLRAGGSLWIIGCLCAMVLPPVSAGSTLTSSLLTNGADTIKIILLLISILIAGFGASTAYLIPWSLLPDAIDSDPDKPAGFYTAWMVFSQKFLVAMSMWIVTFFLQISGYQSPRECTGALTFLEQTISAQIAIRICMGLIPAILVSLGIIMMSKWPNKTPSAQLIN
ncbi:MFS transporter [Prochlorococcus sp. MIT 1300]|uniref:MFS transporter n=1 Tax=Prochlorococcus sp. MIT 1300 TaxID=3096218 RepID=UPI002A762510|nr:MFS transporter [Prochlorococcus sp. MIT 1300]